MNSWLEHDKSTIPHLLSRTKEIAERHYEKIGWLPPSRYIPDLPLQTLPEKGIGAGQVLEYFEKHVASQLANSAGPRYFGFVTGGTTPAATVGDWLVTTYDQNACGSNDSIAPQIERQTIHYLKQLLGLDADYYGTFVTGATMSNFTGMALGRQWIGEQNGIDFSNEGTMGANFSVVSGTPHSSVVKSLSMLGLGRNSLVSIETLPDHEAINVTALETYLKEHPGPHIVVANAGTVNTVDFDDLEAIGELKGRYSFWLHVDAAFGGFAACSERFSHYLAGINNADSITIDAHKWLNVPYDAAMQFTRHKQIQLRVFQNSASYLGDPQVSPDYFHYTPENSRRFRALPAWFGLLAYGREGYREIVEGNCELAKHLGDLIDRNENFRLLAPVRMNVVCFTLEKESVTAGEIQRFLQFVRDDGSVFFTQTVYQGKPGIRAAISNWGTAKKDVELAYRVLVALHEKFSATATV
jgi:glutamate/tyrosine decarboxylase-like PLP-dependent enzyme